MTLEEASEVLNKKKDSVIETWENENVFDCFWVQEDVKAIDTVLRALENDKNAFIKQVKITQEASSLYEKEKEKNIELEKEIRENYIPKEKVREKIKELGKDIPMMTPRYFDWDSSEVIKLLKELLGEE